MTDQPGQVEVAAVPARARGLVELSVAEFTKVLVCVMETGAVEAAIWSLLRRHKATIPDAVPFMDELLAIVNAYAAGDSETVTKLRRAVLHRDSGPQGQTSASGCGGGGGAASELHPSGSTAAGRLSTAVGGATLSTGRDVPAAGKDQAKSHPQAVDSGQVMTSRKVMK